MAIGVVAAGLFGIAPGALAAQPVWHAPVAIAPVWVPGGLAVALASRGEALAAWEDWSGGAPRIEVRLRHGLRAPWSRSQAVWASSPGQPVKGGGAGDLSAPAAAMNARGDAVVLWRVGGGSVWSALRRGRGGSWRRLPVPSGPPTGEPNGGFATPRVAMAADGSAVALWSSLEQGAWVVRGARISSGGTAWKEMPGPPLDTDRLAPPFDPPLTAVDGAGDAVATWRIPAPSGQGYALRAARRTGSGPWGPAMTLSDAAAVSGPEVARNGRAVVVWTADSGGSPPPVLFALGAPGTTDMSAPETLPGATAPWAGGAVNARGDVLVAWIDGGESHAAIRPAGGMWGATMDAPGVLGFSYWPRGPSLALDDAGTGYLAVLHPNEDPNAPEHERPLSVAAGTASGWGRAHVLGLGDTTVALAAAPDGTAIALGTSGFGNIVASSYDAAPDVRVVARVRGRWVARERAVRWTIRVRNAGRIAAQGVRVQFQAGERGRLLAARPPATHFSARTLLWGLGRVARGGGRTIVATIRPRGDPSRAHLWLRVSAASMTPVWIAASVGVPSG